MRIPRTSACVDALELSPISFRTASRKSAYRRIAIGVGAPRKAPCMKLWYARSASSDPKMLIHAPNSDSLPVDSLSLTLVPVFVPSIIRLRRSIIGWYVSYLRSASRSSKSRRRAASISAARDARAERTARMAATIEAMAGTAATTSGMIQSLKLTAKTSVRAITIVEITEALLSLQPFGARNRWVRRPGEDGAWSSRGRFGRREVASPRVASAPSQGRNRAVDVLVAPAGAGGNSLSKLSRSRTARR
jgi:hypothetical protein